MCLPFVVEKEKYFPYMMVGRSYFLVSIGLLTSVISIYYYLKIIKLLMTRKNQEITSRNNQDQVIKLLVNGF